jgi:cellulose synthase/poly-beta-1,6-N-acetylglucosamine synthase-like glycosyltransferase
MYAQFIRQGPQEVRVSKLIRQYHRWLSIIFTATVAANFAFMAFGQPPMWIVYAPLPFLFLLMFSGLYMFVLPHAVRWRTARSVG